MRRTGTWIKFALALPMKYAPGEKFGYCSPGYHLLSGIVTAATHQPLAEFGKTNLFDPLGIAGVVWPPDDQGRTHGWGDSHFHPLDFAKFGYLYLHDGQWDGKQIVSAEWIHKSTTKQSDPGRGNGGGYGYGWWLAKTDGIDEFGGNGRGGQIVAVWPEKDMIVVMTGSGYPAAQVRGPIVNAIRGDTPLPADPDAVRDLSQKTTLAAQAPEPAPLTPLPGTAETISGAVYEFPRNASRLDRLSLVFNGSREARLNFRYLGTDLTIPVGLDGVYRLGPYGPLKLLAGATGKWTSDTDFTLDLNFITNINHYTATLHFEGDNVQVAISESSGLIRNGHLTGHKL
jgi:hypothetical protein